MAWRVNERLNELKQQRTQVTLSDGRALVVVKTALVEKVYATHKVKESTFRSKKRFERDSFLSGRAAGDRVVLTRPLKA